MHFDNGLTDECKKVWTAYGGASVVTANFGATPFAYTPPTGYLAWDTITTLLPITAPTTAHSSGLKCLT